MFRRLQRSIAWRLSRRLEPVVRRRALRRTVQALNHAQVWYRTCWLDVPTVKNPLDLWVFQEIIVETRPEVIVETGTCSGGSALYLASICDLLHSGEVISIDVEPVRNAYPDHARITYLGGRSSTDAEVVREVTERVAGRSAMVILDSDHRMEHVAAELDAYGPIVGDGCYLIVEDTRAGVVKPQLAPGPPPAIQAFLAQHPEFEVDSEREKYLITSNSGGYLRRVA